MEDIFEGQIKQDKLEELGNLCKLYKQKEKSIEQYEESLKLLKKELEDIQRIHIPGILNEAGLSEIRLASGEKIEVSDKLFVSVPDKNYLAVFRNMVILEGGGPEAEEKVKGLFKESVVLQDTDDDVLEMLIERGIPYETKRAIHPQTLRKYCQDRLERGLPLPEGVTNFEYQEAKIK